MNFFTGWTNNVNNDNNNVLLVCFSIVGENNLETPEIIQYETNADVNIAIVQ